MGWQAAFIDALSSPSITPQYRLAIMDTSSVGLAGGGVEFNSLAGSLRIGREGPAISGTSVIPSRWNVTFGGFSIPMVGDIRPYFGSLSRGQFGYIEVNIGTGWERLAFGQLRTITKVGPKYIFGFVDLLSAFTATASTVISTTANPSSAAYIPPQSQIFRNVGRSTTTTSTWAYTDVNMAVAELQYFEQATGSDGIALVTPSGGAPFYVTFSGKSAPSGPGNLTITSTSLSRIYPSANLIPASTASGATVQSATLLKGYPGHILGSILTSTGSGTNGALDIYPKTWSVGGCFDSDIYDYGDSEEQKQYIKSTQNTVAPYNWDYLVRQPWGNGIRELTSSSALCGQWPVFRQGAISWRGCINPDGRHSETVGIVPFPVDHITDRDIISVVSHDLFASDSANIWAWQSVIYGYPATGTLKNYKSLRRNDRVSSLPAGEEIQRDCGYIYAGDPNDGLEKIYRSYRAQGDTRRMMAWDSFVYEKLVLKLHLNKCGLVAGDIVLLTSSVLYGVDESDSSPYKERAAMVISSSFDFATRSSIIGLGMLPSRQIATYTQT